MAIITATNLQISEAEELTLRQRWQELAGNYDSRAVQLWEQLRASYSARTRHYHNLGHIMALLDWAARYREHLQNYDAVRFAIWFHDAVYDTHRNDNEERSAAWATQVLQQWAASSALVSATAQMIMATKTHQAGEPASDTHWFLDFDLAILGSSPECYRAYSQAIRREYNWVPGLLYRRGRRKVLQGFLQREQLFFTAELRCLLEASARQNMQAELLQLS